ncbi:MAG: sigma-70 family RNA polymerase sigma factor [Thermomicrobiales bacterium]
MGADAIARVTQHVRLVAPTDAPDAPDAIDRADILAAQRDPAAFAPLYERYAPAVRGYCLRRLGDPEAAADAASLIFVRALQRLDTFQPNRTGTSTVRSWLFAIAHNTIVDTHRRNAFRAHRSLDAPSAARDGPTPADRLATTDRTTDPEDRALARETVERVRAALTRLPERQRQIVELRMAGLTGGEIASVLGMTPGAVKAAQFRAFGTLRPLLDDTAPIIPTPEAADATPTH